MGNPQKLRILLLSVLVFILFSLRNAYSMVTISDVQPSSDAIFVSHNITFSFYSESNVSTSYTCELIVNGSVVKSETVSNGTTTTWYYDFGTTDHLFTWQINCTDDEGSSLTDERYIQVNGKISKCGRFEEEGSYYLVDDITTNETSCFYNLYGKNVKIEGNNHTIYMQDNVQVLFDSPNQCLFKLWINNVTFEGDKDVIWLDNYPENINVTFSNCYINGSVKAVVSINYASSKYLYFINSYVKSLSKESKTSYGFYYYRIYFINSTLEKLVVPKEYMLYDTYFYANNSLFKDFTIPNNCFGTFHELKFFNCTIYKWRSVPHYNQGFSLLFQNTKIYGDFDFEKLYGATITFDNCYINSTSFKLSYYSYKFYPKILNTKFVNTTINLNGVDNANFYNTTFENSTLHITNGGSALLFNSLNFTNCPSGTNCFELDGSYDENSGACNINIDGSYSISSNYPYVLEGIEQHKQCVPCGEVTSDSEIVVNGEWAVLINNHCYRYTDKNVNFTLINVKVFASDYYLIDGEGSSNTTVTGDCTGKCVYQKLSQGSLFLKDANVEDVYLKDFDSSTKNVKIYNSSINNFYEYASNIIVNVTLSNITFWHDNSESEETYYILNSTIKGSDCQYPTVYANYSMLVLNSTRDNAWKYTDLDIYNTTLYIRAGSYSFLYGNLKCRQCIIPEFYIYEAYPFRFSHVNIYNSYMDTLLIKDNSAFYYGSLLIENSTANYMELHAYRGSITLRNITLNPKELQDTLVDIPSCTYYCTITIKNSYFNNSNTSIHIKTFADATMYLYGNKFENTKTVLKLSCHTSVNSILKMYNNFMNITGDNFIINTTVNMPTPFYLNTTKQPGPNVIGGPYIGGNYWGCINGSCYSDTCTDIDQDGFCDDPYEVLPGYYDYLPLARIDTEPPEVVSINTIPQSPVNYSKGQIYQFWLTTRDDVSGTKEVIFSENSTGTWLNHTMIKVSNEYWNYNLTDLPAITFSYKFYLTDNANHTSVSDTYTYVVQKGFPPIHVLINGKEGRVRVGKNVDVNFTVYLEGWNYIVNLTSNYPDFGAYQGESPLEVIKQFTTTGLNFSAIGCFAGNENYTEGCVVTYFDVIEEAQPPYYSNVITNYPEHYSPPTYTYYRIKWVDNTNVTLVLFETNITGEPLNYTAEYLGNDIYQFKEILPAGTYYWKSYAKDYWNNWAVSDTYYFTIEKAPTSITLTFNGVEGNLTTGLGTEITIHAVLNVSKLICLESNYTNWETICGEQDVSVTIQPEEEGTWYFTAYFEGDQNYTSSSVTYYLSSYYPPIWQNLVLQPENNTEYAPGQNYSFSIDFIDEHYQMSYVDFYENFTGVMTLHHNISNTSSTYYINFTDLPAGVYLLKFVGYNEKGVSNSTEIIYVIKQRDANVQVYPQTQTIDYEQQPVHEYCLSNYLPCKIYRNGEEIQNDTTIILPVGTYHYLAEIDDCQNYTNCEAESTLTIEPKNANVRVFPNETTIEYGTPIQQYCLDDSKWYNCTIERNGQVIENGTTETLPIGTYFYYAYIPDNQNYTNYEDSITVEIVKATPQGHIVFSPSGIVKYPTKVYVTCVLDKGDSGASVDLLKDGQYITSGPSPLTVEFTLTPGNYYFQCYYPETENYTSGYVGEDILVVEKGYPILKIEAPDTVNYGEDINITGYVDGPGADDVPVKMWINGTLVTEGYGSVSYIERLGAGVYEIKVNCSEGSNYVANNTGVTKVLTVEQSPFNPLIIQLYYNETYYNNTNLTIPFESNVTINAFTYYPNAGEVKLYVDGEEVGIPFEFIRPTVGIHTITVNTTGNANYTSNSTTIYINVTKRTPIITAYIEDAKWSDDYNIYTTIKGNTIKLKGEIDTLYPVRLWANLNHTDYGEHFYYEDGKTLSWDLNTNDFEGVYEFSVDFEGDENYTSSIGKTEFIVVPKLEITNLRPEYREKNRIKWQWDKITSPYWKTFLVSIYDVDAGKYKIYHRWWTKNYFYFYDIMKYGTYRIEVLAEDIYGQHHEVFSQTTRAWAWWNEDWRYKALVTMDEADQDYDNVAVKIELNSSNLNWEHVNPDCSDLRFVDFEDGELTSYEYNISYCNYTEEKAIVYVKLPHLDSDYNIKFYVYYGSPTAISESTSREGWTVIDVGYNIGTEEVFEPKELEIYNINYTIENNTLNISWTVTAEANNRVKISDNPYYIGGNYTEWQNATSNPRFTIELEPNKTYYLTLYSFYLNESVYERIRVTNGIPPQTPKIEIVSYEEDRPNKKVKIVGKVTDFLNCSSINVRLIYWEENPDIQEYFNGTTKTITSSSPSPFSMYANVEYGKYYGYGLVGECNNLTFYSEPFYNLFMSPVQLFIGNPLYDDESNRVRWWKGYREGAELSEDWAWVESNITDKGQLYIRVIDVETGESMFIPLDINGEIYYTKLTGLNGWKAFELWNDTSILVNRTKPSNIHLPNESAKLTYALNRFNVSKTTFNYKPLYFHDAYYNTSPIYHCFFTKGGNSTYMSSYYLIKYGDPLADCWNIMYWGGWTGTYVSSTPTKWGEDWERGMFFRGQVADGSWHDSATIEDKPQENYGYVWCGKFIVFYFNQSEVTDEINITNYYLHIWKQNKIKYELHWGTIKPRTKTSYITWAGIIRWDDEMATKTTDILARPWILQPQTKINNLANSYECDADYCYKSSWYDDYTPTLDLYIPLQKKYNTGDLKLNLIVAYKNFSNDPITIRRSDIYDYGVYFQTEYPERFPNIIFGKYHQSFVIFNLPDNETLQQLDSDNDGLNDYEELFVYHTNPFVNDTDNDYVSDYDEIMWGSNPNLWYDVIDLDVPTYENPSGPIGEYTFEEGKELEFSINAYDKQKVEKVLLETNISGIWENITMSCSKSLCKVEVPMNMSGEFSYRFIVIDKYNNMNSTPYFTFKINPKPIGIKEVKMISRGYEWIRWRWYPIDNRYPYEIIYSYKVKDVASGEILYDWTNTTSNEFILTYATPGNNYEICVKLYLTIPHQNYVQNSTEICVASRTMRQYVGGGGGGGGGLYYVPSYHYEEKEVHEEVKIKGKEILEELRKEGKPFYSLSIKFSNPVRLKVVLVDYDLVIYDSITDSLTADLPEGRYKIVAYRGGWKYEKIIDLKSPISLNINVPLFAQQPTPQPSEGVDKARIIALLLIIVAIIILF